MRNELTLVVIAASVYVVKKDGNMAMYAAAIAFVILEWTRSHTIPLHLVNDANGLNESLVIEAKLNGERTLFMLDSGYAGSLVISTSFMAVQRKCRHGSVLSRYRNALELLRTGVDDDARHRVVDELIRYRKCQTYTSGCTMTLAGIASTVQQQADMLMCHPVEFRTRWGWYATPTNHQKPRADVLVTNPLPTSVNILTCDYLIHSSPALIKMKSQTLELFLSPLVLSARAHTFTFVEGKMMGGAFVLPVRLSGGEIVHCTMDTGAPGPICLGPSAIGKLAKCQRSMKKVIQVGVNGERICSDVLYTSGSVGGIHFDRMGVFANDVDTDGVDGYVGLSVLRALDILVLPNSIGLRPSGLAPNTNFSGAATGTCGKQYACET